MSILKKSWRVALSGATAVIMAAAPAMAQLGALSAGDDPSGRVARLSALDGALSLLTAGSSSWAQPSLNYTVTTGDRLYAPPGARAELDIGSSAMRLGDGADVGITALTDNVAQFALNGGTTRTSIYRRDAGQSFELDTPNGALIPRTPGRYRVSVDPGLAVTTVSVESGDLEVSAPGLDRTVTTGQSVRLVGTDPVQMTFLSFNPGDDFERWALTRDRRFEANDASMRYVGGETPGWEDLDDYGNWYDEPSYGPVWYPRSVGSDWVPYRDGHWAWVEPWGWSWVDNAQWGFAPFHYGRWAHLSRGWGWVPGPVGVRPVYSPALVMFLDRQTFRDPRQPRVEAWFPLAPREPYFPAYRHSDDYLRRVNAADLRGADVDRFLRDRDVDHYAWQNRTQAITAVRDETLRNGSPVSRGVIRLRPEEIAGAHLSSGFATRPDPRVMAAGNSTGHRPPPITHPVIARGLATAPQHQPSQMPRAGNAPRMVPPTAPLYTRPVQRPQPPLPERHQQVVGGEVVPPRPAPRRPAVQAPPPPRTVHERIQPVPSRPPSVQPATPSARRMPVFRAPPPQPQRAPVVHAPPRQPLPRVHPALPPRTPAREAPLHTPAARQAPPQQAPRRPDDHGNRGKKPGGV